MLRKEKERDEKIIVIGGGPAGMTAAIVAARNIGGAHVLLLEKNDRLGRKLLATGNGRCNLTNRFSKEQLTAAVSEIYDQFNVDATLNFFLEIGLLTRQENAGRLYPYSEQALSVLSVLEAELMTLGVEIRFRCHITELEQKEGFFRCKAQTESDCGRELVFSAREIVLAVGGKAGPQFGSVGEGFSLAKKLGHTVVTPFPSLTQILSVKDCFKELKGVRAKAQATLLCEDKPLAREFGEIQFTPEGLSGICIFNLSRFVRLKGHRYEDYTLRIDFMPEFTEDTLETFLFHRAENLRRHHGQDFLEGVFAPKLARVMLKEAGWNDDQLRGRVWQLSLGTIKRLTKLLKKWDIVVSGTKGWKEAQVTCGGVDLAQLHEKTLESKKAKGLFFAGEVVDFDGPCGGYNLQWAWSSGFAAGFGAAKKFQIQNKKDEVSC